MTSLQTDIYKKEYIMALFNRMSSSYERVNYITSFGFSLRWRRQFLDHTQCDSDKPEILDLLGGMGEIWPSVKQHYPNARITCLDFSSKMLQYAKKRNQKHFKNTVQLLNQDALDNNLKSNSYDVVACAFGLKTFNQAQLGQLGEEVYRLLKPGGTFSFVEVSAPDNKILHSLYGFYLGAIIPMLGKLFLGNPSDYRMLWKHTRNFVNSKVALKAFNGTGLSVDYSSYFYGCATGIYGHKPR